MTWNKYPVRCCRWLNHCVICNKDITSGQKYRDGGYRKRAHITCTGETNPFFHPDGPMFDDGSHIESEGYYFWAEDQCTYYGPFVDIKEAETKLKEYCSFL